jgi:hypothetical protein
LLAVAVSELGEPGTTAIGVIPVRVSGEDDPEALMATICTEYEVPLMRLVIVQEVPVVVEHEWLTPPAVAVAT